jgi:cbb3-type cytochrome oxidase subunit 3
MLREAFSHPNPWAAVALLVTLALFTAIVVYVATDRRRSRTERHRNLPLEDDRHA